MRYDDIEIRLRPATEYQEARPATATKVALPEREIVVAGHSYEVRELVDPASLTPTLVFMGANVARRVRSYPPNWRELTDEALAELSWSR